MANALSLSMIVKDEESTISGVLSDIASICDEIIVVDTGSTDGTVEIAQSFGAQVFTFTWINDFSAARNFSLSKCHGDWVLWLDADDRVPPMARDAFRQIYEEVRLRSDADAVFCPYRREFSPVGSDNCSLSVNVPRLFRNDGGLQWHGAIHEGLVASRDDAPLARFLVRTDAWVDHRPSSDQIERKVDRNFSILQDAVRSGDRSFRNLKYLALELYNRSRFEEAYAIFEEALQLPSDDERYRVYCAFGECARVLGKEEKQLQLLAQAIAYDSSRAEAFVVLGELYFNKQEWAKAVPFFTAAAALAPPEVVDGPILEPAYSYLPWDYLSVCANKLGRYKEALEYTIRALPGNPDRERLITNLRYNLDELEKS